VLVHNKNPFKGKSFEQIGLMLEKKGFIKKGIDPVKGKGSYLNPNTNQMYYFDKGLKFNEKPHIDVFYTPNNYFIKKKFFLEGGTQVIPK